MAGAHVSTRRMLPAGEARPAAPEAGQPSVRRRRAALRLESRGSELRPRGVGQILDTAVELFTRRFAALVGLVAAVWFPLEICSQIVLRAKAEALLLTSPLFEAPMQALATALVCSLVSADLAGAPISAGESLRRALSRFPGVLGLLVLTTVVALPLACLCVVPMLFAYWLLGVAQPVYVVERAGFLESLRRSVRLVSGWEGLGRWLGSWFGTLPLVLPFVMSTSAFYEAGVRDELRDMLGLPEMAFLCLAALVAAAFNGIGAGLPAVVTTVYYVDRRVRREGLDLEVQLAELDRRHPSARGAAA